MKILLIINLIFCQLYCMTGYLYENEISNCQDACSQYAIHHEVLDIAPTNVIFDDSITNIDLYLNRFVDVDLGEEITCIECTAFQVQNISISDDCEYTVDCFQDPCITYECDDNPNIECFPNFCGGCYADFYDFNESLTECVVLDNSGDLNNDGEINVIDIVLLVSNILDGIVNENGDINQDNLLNVVDVVLLVDMVLNQENLPETGLFISQQYQPDELTYFYDIEYSQRPNPYGLQYSSSRTQQEELLQDTIFLHLDLVLPPNPENKLLPMVVMIHGGGFHGGNKEQKLHYAEDYAQLGYIGCTINYRLTLQNVIQQSDDNLIAAINDAVEDAMNAIRYLKTQSSIYSIDNNRIVTIGNSAGAFISLHNAIDNDESLPEQESINDYPGFSSSVSASVSTGAVFPNEALITLNFDEDDASCLIMHAEDYDSVTDTYWEDDVIPFYEAIINSGNYADLVAQPPGSHGVGVGPFEEYSEDIVPFIWNQLNLNEW